MLGSDSVCLNEEFLRRVRRYGAGDELPCVALSGYCLVAGRQLDIDIETLKVVEKDKGGERERERERKTERVGNGNVSTTMLVNK